jgi:ATP-dependent DNA helicase RecG
MKENQNTEWKTSWLDEYMKWLCGFANAHGGMLDVGRNDAGKVVGLENAERLLEELPNKLRDLLGVVGDINLMEEDGKQFLRIVVEPYPVPISYRGEYHYRSGSTKQVLKGGALDRFLLGKIGKRWDGAPLPGVEVEDLDPAALAKFRERATRSKRLGSDALNEEDQGLMEKLRLTEGSYLKRAAVLLFHPDPERYVTGAAIKIGYFATESDLRYHDEVQGDLFTQVDKTMDLLLTKYLKATISYEGIQRVESFPMPVSALREALLNAVVHRDYAVPAPIQIRVYANRLVIWNSGELPENWTNEKLMGRHSSEPYNPDIANTFFRAGEIEAWGRGIQRVLEACQEAGTPTPEILAEPRDLRFEFPFSKAYLASLSAEIPEGTTPKTPVKTPVKTPDRVLALLRENPNLTLVKVAAALEKSTSAIERAAKKLGDAGKLKYMGPQKGGHWEVLEVSDE